MPTRVARTAWTGTLQEGSGQVELSGSKVGTFEVSFPRRTADEAAGGGLQLTGIALEVHGEVEGLDKEGFEAAAQAAKQTCPVSKALTGVEITLDATLD